MRIKHGLLARVVPYQCGIIKRIQKLVELLASLSENFFSAAPLPLLCEIFLRKVFAFEFNLCRQLYSKAGSALQVLADSPRE